MDDPIGRWLAAILLLVGLALLCLAQAVWTNANEGRIRAVFPKTYKKQTGKGSSRFAFLIWDYNMVRATSQDSRERHLFTADKRRNVQLKIDNVK